MRILARLRNLMVSGFIFIMPVLITVLILGQFWKQLLRVGSALSRMLRIDTVLGPSGDAVAAVVFFVVVCLIAGFLTRISFLRRVSEQIDEKLNQLIPGYSQVRTEATKKVGSGVKEGAETVGTETHKVVTGAPKGSTGKCHDGTYTKVKTRSSACAKHGGVKTWY